MTKEIVICNTIHVVETGILLQKRVALATLFSYLTKGAASG
ncbi:hypothetical protein [Peribacillus sp. AS_2]|nr:hypothetical protein [Peribacillus sp. AS_2]MCZ0874558.1 hypothetical protein [Peribacillus sp. AS_2]